MLDLSPQTAAVRLRTLPDDAPSTLWTAVENSLRKNSENPDIEAAKLLFASVAAHRIVHTRPLGSWQLRQVVR